jgi:hypothetical protein
MDDSATYLYCIIHAAALPKTDRPPRGLPGSTRPSLLPVYKSMWIVVAEVPLDTYGPRALEASLRDMKWVADVAVAHEAVVEHFARRPGATVIPMKLFTMFSAAERAIAETKARRPDITAVLKRIAGCEEWGVRVMRSPSTTRRGARVAGSSGVAFLAAKKRVRDEALDAIFTAAACAAGTFDSLAGISRDARRREDAPAGAASPPLLDAVFLVPTDRRARFRSAARRLAAGAAGAGAEMTLSGPWPPYNFVDAEPS